MCNHSVRVTRSPPMRCGPMSRSASKIEKYIPADARAANQVKIRIANGCLEFGTEQLRTDRAKIALRRAPHCSLRVRENVRFPPSTVNLIERKRFDSFENTVNCSGSERNEIRITAHETDIAPILHYLNDVASQQSAFASCTCWPMQHCAPFE